MSSFQEVQKKNPQWEFPDFKETVFSEKAHKYCVCVFVINEGERVRSQLKRMKYLSGSIDIVVADGGSTDGSLGRAFLKSQNVRALLTKVGKGKLSAQMRMAFAWALNEGYKGVVVVDGNNKDSVEDIPDFIKLLDSGYDHIQGSRFIPGGRAVNTPLSRRFGLHLLHAPLISLAAGKRHTDTTNGFRAYSANLLRNEGVAIFRNVFQTYELHYYLAIESSRRKIFKTTETPVVRKYPKYEKTPTKISPVKGNLHVLKVLFSAVLGAYRLNSLFARTRGYLKSWNFSIWSISFVFFLISTSIMFPGLSSDDTGQQWRQVLGVIPVQDWHPPIMVWLWGLLHTLTDKFSSLLMVQELAFWLAIGWIAISIWKLSKSKLMSILPIILALLPQVWILTGVIWKDVQLATALLLATAILLNAKLVGRLGWVAGGASLLLISYGSLLRYNALIAVIPLLFAWWSLISPRTNKFTYRLVASLATLVLVSVFSLLASTLSHVQKVNPSSAVMLDDIVNVSTSEEVSHTSPRIQATINHMQIECRDKGIIVNTYWGCTSGEGRNIVSNSNYDDIKQLWMQTLIHNPLKYTAYRALTFSVFLFGDNERQYVYADNNIIGLNDSNNAVFEKASTLRTGAIEKYTNSFAYGGLGFIFRPWFWLLLSILLLFYTQRHKGSGYSLSRVLLLSSVLYIVSYIPMVVATDYRYIYWSVLASSVGLILIVANKYVSRKGHL